MSEAEDYTVLDTQYPADSIKREVRDGRLYCDGVPVAKWQLTPDELREFFPEEYVERSLPHEGCPLTVFDAATSEYVECGRFFEANNRTGWMSHARGKHSDWYSRNEEFIRKYESPANIFKAIKANLDTKP